MTTYGSKCSWGREVSHDALRRDRETREKAEQELEAETVKEAMKRQRLVTQILSLLVQKVTVFNVPSSFEAWRDQVAYRLRVRRGISIHNSSGPLHASSSSQVDSAAPPSLHVSLRSSHRSAASRGNMSHRSTGSAHWVSPRSFSHASQAPSVSISLAKQREVAAKKVPRCPPLYAPPL